MMIATAFISMWIANVTAAVMMYPIALAIIAREESETHGKSSFQVRSCSCRLFGNTWRAGHAHWYATNLTLSHYGEVVSRLPQLLFHLAEIGMPVLLILLPSFAIT